MASTQVRHSMSASAPALNQPAINLSLASISSALNMFQPSTRPAAALPHPPRLKTSSPAALDEQRGRTQWRGGWQFPSACCPPPGPCCWQ